MHWFSTHEVEQQSEPFVHQDRIPFVQQREASGHAVRANYLFAGVADLYLENGDPALWTSLEALWRNVTTTKLYVTGGCGALYDGASPDGSAQQASITLPNAAHVEALELAPIIAIDDRVVTLDGARVADTQTLASSPQVERIEQLVQQLETLRRNW